mmetsp:Transcript_918/g.1597  ORF Transcript_918/g.1597 Transcript_918/m.1597 type:complete len:168 (+) Transcript_918:2350-2853(+)
MYWQTIWASQRLKKLSLNSKFFDEFLEFFNSASVYFDVRWQFFRTRVHTQSYRFLPCSPLFNLKQQQQQQQQQRQQQWQQHKFALRQIYVRVVAAFQRGKFCYSPSYGIARLGRAAAAQDTPSSASGHSRASVAFRLSWRGPQGSRDSPARRREEPHPIYSWAGVFR